jgi:plasmid stabilization system protein ParE
MTFAVRLTAEAEANVRDIRDWIAKRSYDGALRWLESLEAAKERLREGADQFALAAEADAFDEKLREISFKTRRGNVYRALFVIRKETVHVVSVRGPGQDWIKPDEVVIPD